MLFFVGTVAGGEPAFGERAIAVIVYPGIIAHGPVAAIFEVGIGRLIVVVGIFEGSRGADGVDFSMTYHVRLAGEDEDFHLVGTGTWGGETPDITGHGALSVHLIDAPVVGCARA